MKYCLSSLCKDTLLSQIDEIKVLWKNRKIIPDFAEKYPNATIILHKTSLDNSEAWEEIKEYNILCKNKLIVAVKNLEEINIARENNIKCFLGYPITSFYELQSIKDLPIEYIRLNAPLFFELDKVKAITNIPIRAIPNIAYNDGLPRENGVFGQWIRPEDLETTYAEYIDTVEFEGIHTDQEELLYDIYHIRKHWKFDLQDIIVNLNTPGKNKMLPPKIGEKRLNCGQRCQYNPEVCQFCKRALDMAIQEKVVEYVNTLYPDHMPTDKEFEEWEKEKYPTQ